MVLTQRGNHTSVTTTQRLRPKAEVLMTYSPGDRVSLHGRLFANSQTHCGTERTGNWYIYDGKLVDGRYRITNLIDRVMRQPQSRNVSGYANASDLSPIE